MKNNESGKLWSGIMFIILGFVFLIESFFPRINIEDFWPILLIITGGIIIYDGLKQYNPDEIEITPTEEINNDNL